MPVNSRYSDEQFESIMQDVFTVLENHSAQRDLSLLVLGNVITQIFNQQKDDSRRNEMVDSFCRVLKKTTQ